MADEIAGGIGEDGRGNAVGKDISQARATARGGDQYFGGSTEQEIAKLWAQVAVHSSQILDLLIKLDDIPNRIRYLERTEVIIRPGADPVIVRPAPESVTIPMRVVLTALSVGLALVLGLVIYLVFQQRGA